ncbi:MAG: A/G-specific adenine glycosylase [Lachnospiraceae bacterium]|nr:A/G-specific adenine glycosylase [Lachnospiraceae bacterium]
MTDRELLTQLQKPLISWFEENARVLPWREHPFPISGQVVGSERSEQPLSLVKLDHSERTPGLAEQEHSEQAPGFARSDRSERAHKGAQPDRAYAVWVSEIMLQQTRVEAVKPYYLRFMDTLPDIRALAECPEDALLKLWEGLGYYSRVRNMQKAARVVMEQYEGRLPGKYEELLALPGIGSYTAGAIASIAYGQAVPAVDGNVLRVISRITENAEDISKQSVKKSTEDALRAVMPQACPGTFNQALMELGALICVPNGAPLCEDCPLCHLCRANLDGCQTAYPVKAAKKARRVEERTVLVIRDSTHAAIGRRPAHGLLAGLYELPNYLGHLTQEEAAERVAGNGFSPLQVRPLPEAKHIFSHVEWHMSGYFVLVEDMEESRKKTEGDQLIFADLETIRNAYPIPSAFAAYQRYFSYAAFLDAFSGKR